MSFLSDWSCIASLCVLGSARTAGLKGAGRWLLFTALYAAVYCFALDVVYGLLQMAVALSLPVLARYNGLRGKDPRINRVMKWLFYLYYPLHLAILGTIQYLR
ncbi:MAG: TraX family protein [Oscillospiraceae bacterium]